MMVYQSVSVDSVFYDVVYAHYRCSVLCDDVVPTSAVYTCTCVVRPDPVTIMTVLIAY